MLHSLALGVMVRLARFLGFNYLSVYAPGEDVLALHLARDEVTMARSMDDYLNAADRPRDSSKAS